MGAAKNVTVVENLEDYVRAINIIRPSKDAVMVFRGHSDWEHTLAPAIYREPDFIKNEPEMIREALARAPDDFASDENVFERLVRLQHYGLPTRMLDVTYNALAALYFGCRRKEKTQGEVIVFLVPRDEFKFFDSDTVALLAAQANLPVDFNIDELSDDNGAFNRDEEVLRLVHEVKNDKPGFEPKINKGDLRRIVCVQPKLSNRRIAVQDGAFLLFGINGKKDLCPTIPNDWIARGPGKKRIVFRKKHSLKTELAKFGIAEHILFPELDKQTEYILSRYKGKYRRD
jgi:hypothetical protein